MQSIFPVLSSCSLESQLMGCARNFTPKRFETSLAKSMSKPTISFFSSRKPIGGNESSKPRTKTPLLLSSAKELSPFAPFLAHPAKVAATRAAAIAVTISFFISSPIFLFLKTKRRAACASLFSFQDNFFERGDLLIGALGSRSATSFAGGGAGGGRKDVVDILADEL